MKWIYLNNEKKTCVDDADFERFRDYKWTAANVHGYWIAVRKAKLGDGRRTTIMLHREILHAGSDLQVDHINGDTLNNTRSNLRLCLQSENKRNRKKPSTGVTSKYKGVSLWRGRWKAQITSHGTTHYLGLFKTEAEAAKAYNEAAEELHANFARKNRV